jgi:phosphoglycerate kinase
MNLKTIRDVDVKDKTVLVRVDYNVPIKDGEVESDLRISASLPTIQFLLDGGAKKVVLISHLGRPEGKENPEFSLKPAIECLRALLPGPEIGFFEIKKGQHLVELSNCRVALLENLRFDPREEANDTEFAKEIVEFTGAEIFVQDGFAVVHRAHASTDAITKLLPSYAGLLLEKEINGLSKVIDDPERPLLMIIGGAKVEDKAPLIEKFIGLADQIAVGGKIAADGYTNPSDKIYVADDFDEDTAGAKLDVGPSSTIKIAEMIQSAKTVVWNGLLGKAEDAAYATSSTIVAELMGESADKTTVICGGDTTGFVEQMMLEHPQLKYSLVSTGGGAALEFLLGNDLPGLAGLK